MIEAIYNRRRCCLIMLGHAGSGEEGHDLVCAAASMLVYTLSGNVAELRDAGQASDAVIELEKGRCRIACRPERKYAPVVRMIFDAVCRGFLLLANQYPAYVKLRIVT